MARYRNGIEVGLISTNPAAVHRRGGRLSTVQGGPGIAIAGPGLRPGRLSAPRARAPG